MKMLAISCLYFISRSDTALIIPHSTLHQPGPLKSPAFHTPLISFMSCANAGLPSQDKQH